MDLAEPTTEHILHVKVSEGGHDDEQPAGLALVVAGITLVWKRIQMLNDLVLLSLLFFSGALLPLAEMPGRARTVGTPLFMTHAVAGLRAIMLDGHSLTLRGISGLAWMLTAAAAWFIAGLLVFRACERIAQGAAPSHT